MALSQSMYGPVVEQVVGPTANDDSSAGYEVGTIWIDTVADEVFLAVDVAVGAAVWAGPLTSTAHVPVTLGGGSDPALTLVGQVLTLANVLTPAEHTAIGDAAPHHASFLQADADLLYEALGDIAAHAAISGAHHTKYTDVEAVAAVEGEATLILTGVVTNTGSFAVPVGAAPVVDADGEIALDTTVANWSHGIFRAYGGEELFLVAMPIAELNPADGFVIAYNATNDELEFVAVGAGGHTIRDDGADQPSRTGLNFIGPIITVTDDAPNDEQEITVDETQIDHDNLANFVANEHIDHTAVTLTAGTALTGGGDISANRTFDHDQVAVGDLHQDYILADGSRPLSAGWNPGAFTLGNFDYTARPAALAVGDANFAMIIAAGTPVLSFDSNDFLFYDRAGNLWQFRVGGTPYLQVSASGIAVDTITELTGASGVTIDSVLLKDGDIILGRAGEGVIYGGDAANEDLLLRATSHATIATSQVQLFVDTNATMTLTPTAQIFGSDIVEVQFLNATAVDFTNAAGFEVVRFSDASAAGGPAVTFATGELQVNEDIDISGHIAIGASASVDPTAGVVLMIAETSTATGAVNVNQLDVAHTYTPGAISSATFRGVRMDLIAGGDEDVDGAFLAGATALQFVTQHDSEGDINQLVGAAGQCIMGNSPLDAASTKTPQFGFAFAQGIGMQGIFIYGANDGYAGAAFSIFPDVLPLGVKAIDAQLQLRSFHDAGRDITMNGDSSGIAVTMDTSNQAVGPKTNRITITDLAGIRISHVDPNSSATIITGTMLKIGAWSSQPTYTNGPYGISQEGPGDVNWLAGFTYVGGAALPSLATANNAALTVDQENASGAIPSLILDQADVSEEIIEFITTIGVGNAIEAVGVKTLTTTHFIKVTLPGALTRYIPVGTIA